jgi:hypothetical protein
MTTATASSPSSDSLRSVGIEHGVSRLHLYRNGVALPLAPGHAAEVVRDGGGGRVFIVVLQPAARESGWSRDEEQAFRALVQRTLDTEFRGHGQVSIEYSG